MMLADDIRKDDKTNAFLTKIDYYNKVKKIKFQKGVVFEWPDLMKLIFSVDSGAWKRSYESISFEKSGLILWSSAFSKVGAVLSVDVFVASDETEKAFKKLIEIASSNSMPRVPYECGDSFLGQLSIKHSNPALQRILWAYYNVVIRISVEEENDNVKTPSIDATLLANKIQKLLENSLVEHLSEHLPKIDRIDVSPQPVAIKNPVTLNIITSKSTDFENLKLSVLGNYEDYQYLGEDKSSVTIAIEKPGKKNITIGIVDKKTLLSVFPVVTVDVHVN